MININLQSATIEELIHTMIVQDGIHLTPGYRELDAMIHSDDERGWGEHLRAPISSLLKAYLQMKGN